MLLRASRLGRLSSLASSSRPLVEAKSPLSRDSDQRDVTNIDLIEERIRQRQAVREITIGGQTQRWNYRSEIVGKLDLDKSHRNIWISFGLTILFGFGAFVYVKSNVVLSRKEEMEERERIRKSLNLLGSERKKVGVVDN